MKNYKIIFLTTFFLMFGTLASFDILLASDFQDIEPQGIKQVIAELFGKFFLTSLAFAGFTAIVSNYLIKFIKPLKNGSDTTKQIFAIGVAVMLSAGGYWAELGIFADLTLIAALMQGFNIGLSSNGVYDFINKFNADKGEDEPIATN